LDRSEHASEFKILIQSTHSEEPYEDEDLLSPGSAGRSSRRFLVLLACTIVGFVMNVLVSVVAPFFPAEAKRLTGTNNTVIGLIFAIFPLTSLVVAPIINLVRPLPLADHGSLRPPALLLNQSPLPARSSLFRRSVSAAWAASGRCAGAC
jgi:hypothetical protein